MSKNSSTKKMKSIAIKINSLIVRKCFFKFLITDIIILISAIGIWCYQTELEYTDSINPRAERSIEYISNDRVDYKFRLYNGDEITVNAAPFLIFIKNVGYIVLIYQLISIIKEIVFGTSVIRKKLKPLNDIAETTSMLSNLTFDENKIQSLEEAIERISPIVSDELISTGDSELFGLEMAINNLLERMRESYKQQARFVSDASHELRTPIAVIQGYANMLDRWGKKDEKILDESIEAIKSESENMKNLVEQLLFLARGINGKTQLNNKEFSLSKMMREVYEESIMIDENHAYKLNGNEDIKINGDEGLLKQTARILIENAVKYSGQGDTIKLSYGINENNKPYFQVQDNGIGMSQKDVAHIFERFFRADTARDRKTGGTGLGLSIAKWIIDRHNGYFSVISRKDIGTRITVYLEKNI